MKKMKRTKKIILGVGLGLLTALLLLGGIYHILPLFQTQETPVLSICMPEGRPLRIAQFADLHFGDGESMYHNTQEARTMDYMAYVVETAQPDLIVCSGDQVMSVGVRGIKEFIARMDSFQTPWVFVWGNHDAESRMPGYSKREMSAALAASKSPYLLYTGGYTEGGRENRYGNFSISVLDAKGETRLGALMFLDSGVYDYEEEAYQTITDGQVAWYKDEVDGLRNEDGTLLPTILFAHMPLPDFSVACRKAAEFDGAEFVIEGGRWFGSGGTNDARSPLFEAMVEKGSTKAYFVGHYHVANYQVRMDGILLGFGPQTGFSHGGYDTPRSTYVYSISEDFSITTENCAEVSEENQRE